MSLRCAKCLDHQAVVDLTTKEGRHKLSDLLASVRLGSVSLHGNVLQRVRVLPIGRQVMWILARVAFVTGAAGWLIWGPKGPGIQAVFASVFISFIFGAFAILLAYTLVFSSVIAAVGFVAVYALLCRKISEALSGLGQQNLAGRLLRNGEHRLRQALNWTEQAFVLRVKIDTSLQATGEHRALTGKFDGQALQLLTDGSSDFALCDGVTTEFNVRTESDPDTLVRVECAHAVFELEDMTLLQPPAAELAPIEQLSWLPVDAADRERWESQHISTDIQVQVTGGEWHEQIDPQRQSSAFRTMATRMVVRGTPNAPLFVKILSQSKR